MVSDILPLVMSLSCQVALWVMYAACLQEEEECV